MDLVEIENGERIIRRNKDELIETLTRIIESQMRVMDFLRKRIHDLELHELLSPLIEIIPEIKESA